MKIIKKAETKKTPFMDIEVGECFILRDEPYIRFLLWATTTAIPITPSP